MCGGNDCKNELRLHNFGLEHHVPGDFVKPQVCIYFVNYQVQLTCVFSFIYALSRVINMMLFNILFEEAKTH